MLSTIADCRVRGGGARCAFIASGETCACVRTGVMNCVLRIHDAAWCWCGLRLFTANNNVIGDTFWCHNLIAHVVDTQVSKHTRAETVFVLGKANERKHSAPALISLRCLSDTYYWNRYLSHLCTYLMHFDLATAFHKPIEQLASAKNWDLANKL